MNFNIDDLKKKIIYRSNYRGKKELDILLSNFVKSIINDLNINELNDLYNLLNIDDENLFNFYNGYMTSIIIKTNKINTLFKKYKLK